MGVCFLKNESLFLENGSFFLENGSLFLENGSLFFVCDLQCDLLISGCLLSRPMSVALSGYTVVTVLLN